MKGYTAAELVQCAERELKIRQQVYPNRIMTGRMSARAADRQIDMMRAIVEVLREHATAEQLDLEVSK
jgi:hypothetical protein